MATPPLRLARGQLYAAVFFLLDDAIEIVQIDLNPPRQPDGWEPTRPDESTDAGDGHAEEFRRLPEADQPAGR